MQKITMRLMVNVIITICLIYILASLGGLYGSEGYKLKLLFSVAILTVGIKNNIKSNRTRMIVTIVGSISAIIIFMFA